ncbi:transcriptional regulator ATRX homolog, partial [Cydia fagiglandana]|uniref:transcriptional regulator ATRX homolog n=1 Tax=Cydia fagiglandana TaxID=1458189 RepID=UPI002FEE64E5
MAEEVPVSDVLCEAMEYLCKLGSNLRTRSQNLKDRKISKDKLRNTHAVRKAASKVLLICELSRKSLENVENGVKRVLTLVDAARRSPVTVGAKDENRSRNKKNYFYFEYDSCKLRISEKILLAHYTSVKVHARSMPESMMDKYPVYYHCSLYKKRKQSLKDSGNENRLKTSKKEDRSYKSAERAKESEKSDSDSTSSGKQIKDKINKEKKRIKGKLNSDDSDNSTKEKEAEEKDKNKQLKCRPKKKKTKESEDETTAATHSDGGCEDRKKENKDSRKESKDSWKGPTVDAEIESKSTESDGSPLNSKQMEHGEMSSKKDPSESINSSDEEEICNKFKKSTKKIVSNSSEEDSNDDKKFENRKVKRGNNSVDSDDEKSKPTDKLDSKYKSRRKSLISDSEEDSNDDKKLENRKVKQANNSVDSDDEKSKPTDKLDSKTKSRRKSLISDSEEDSNDDKKLENRKVKQANNSVDSDDEKSKPTDKLDSKTKSRRKSLISDSEENKLSGEKSKKSKSARSIESDSDQKSNSVTGNEREKKKLDKESRNKKNKIDESEIVNLIEDSPMKPKENLKNKENKADSDTEQKSDGVKGNESKKKKRDKESDSKNNRTDESEIVHLIEESPMKPKDNLKNKESKEDSDSSMSDKKPMIKTVRFIDSDSDQKNISVTGNERKKRKLDNKGHNKNKKTDESEIVHLIEDSPMKPKENLKSKESKEDSDSSTSDKKPMIKLVSLNKLLKPDVLQKEMYHMNTKIPPVSKTYKNRKEKSNPQEDEKKKAISAFKPKKFDVVVTRLPKFTDVFLCEYGLKKITQNGSEIYSLTSLKNKEKEKSSLKTDQNNSRSESKEKSCDNIDSSDAEKSKLAEGIEASKNALLNSDSDDVDTNKPQNCKNSRRKSKARQSDSEKDEDSDKKKSKSCSPTASNKTRSKSPKDVDKNGKIASECKEKLARNSDPENIISLDSVATPKTPERKTEETEKTTPQSRRKLIMESMHAKKMLLTYSSSSDTDDDQLKNALKEIKNSLLKGSSSDDELDVKKIVQMNRRKLVTPSDSDDSLNIKKKKRGKELAKGKEQEDSSISQVDGTNDELSNSSCSQMGRSKTKPASSSSENVDTVDSEINRLSNLKTLNRRRRASVERTTRSTRRMPKAPPIKDEVLALASSGSGSESEHEAAETEELPPISMPKLNGDSINHIAKEDLLAQSDPSSSENEKANGSEDDKKESDSDEDTVKSTRRKANAIASDSEAEAARKADRMSDFEESEDESSEPRKKSKRKKKVTDSDGSVSSSDGGKKKRRRIKQVNDSDGSGSDTENEGRNKHGRKNIRKVMSKDQLEEATKKAARQEKERIARIAERQKLYNNLEFDESGKPDEVVLDKVVLDFDPETKEPIIEVDRGLVKKLKPHQANGIKFMWNACFESVKRIKKDRGSGCILAHCMGLGKTLQVVSLTHTLLAHSKLTGVKRVLVVCPLSTVLNWVNEFTMWLKHAETDTEVDVFELSRHKQNSERSWQLQQWVECGGVCVLGYEMFRNLSADNNKKFKKKMLKTFQEALVDPGPDLVVCDEGHLLKNEKTSLSQSMNRVRTLRRIVLTGTPLQNNLKEYYCMVQFVKPNLLGKYNEYLNRFVNPITNGQYTDSTERDICLMKRRSHVLHTMLDGAVQRRDYGVLAPFLPPKHEYVLFITLTDIQIKLYQHYLDNYSRRPLPGKSSGFLFPDFQSLQRIWTHPLVLKYNSERYEIMQQKKRDKEEEDSEGSLADFIDDDSTPEESSTEESSDDLSDLSDDSRKKSKKKTKVKKGKGKDAKASGRRNTRANPVELEEDKPNSDIEEIKYENPTEWWMKLVTEEELEDIRHSNKLLLLFDILRQCEAIGDKLLVFSQSLYSLDLIEHFLGKVDEATQEGRIDEKLAGHVGSWSPGVDYFRLDGSTSCENRSIWCKNFNREDNPRARLFLISTRAGGLGINLVAANRVVIFDVSWNPSHDVQSIFRVYRFGQKKPCYIYRFLAMGTMEEKIYERQVTKQAISKRVIDEQQIDRHYAANDLAELYKFEPVPVEPRPVPKLPKDRLFAEMLKDHENRVFRFHEHDSLLENKEEETLSEEERKKAWEEFENEKKAPPPSPFPNTWSMHNGMASLLQQQQQQLAYAALAAMIRKDMPNINDNQIRDMLPIICNANPGMFGGYDYGLMQKMSEIYKYAQPGMMNPSMMNPVMNPAGGMSTSSSLQYEPPWQRQQQQQQQMRLQQLMQQQHNMGAKYYAGGLGSRDPVAMALQQQRAREFLLGGGGGAGAAGGAPAGAGAGA